MTQLLVLPHLITKIPPQKNSLDMVSLLLKLILCSVKSKSKIVFQIVKWFNPKKTVCVDTDLQSVNGTVSAKKVGYHCATPISTPSARWKLKRSSARLLVLCIERATALVTTSIIRNGELLSVRFNDSYRLNTATESKRFVVPFKADLCHRPAPSAL